MTARDARPLSGEDTTRALRDAERRSRMSDALRGDVAFDGLARVARGVVFRTQVVTDVPGDGWKSIASVPWEADGDRWINFVTRVWWVGPGGGVPASGVTFLVVDGQVPGSWVEITKDQRGYAASDWSSTAWADVAPVAAGPHRFHVLAWPGIAVSSVTLTGIDEGRWI